MKKITTTTILALAGTAMIASGALALEVGGKAPEGAWTPEQVQEFAAEEGFTIEEMEYEKEDGEHYIIAYGTDEDGVDAFVALDAMTGEIVEYEEYDEDCDHDDEYDDDDHDDAGKGEAPATSEEPANADAG